MLKYFTKHDISFCRQLMQNIKTEMDDVKFLQVIQRQQRSSFGILRDPPILDFDPQHKLSFQIWKEKWESWLYMAIQRGGLDRNQIYHSLKNCFTDRTMGYFLSLKLNETAENNPELVIQSFSALVTSSKNHNYFRHAFQSRFQKSGEKFDVWLADLKDLMKSADYDQECGGKCKDARLLQQVIAGVFQPQTRQMLFDIGSGLTLDQAARIIKTTEFGNVTRVQVQEHYNAQKQDDSMGHLNQSYLSTSPSWPNSFEVNQYSIQTDIIASTPGPNGYPSKKRKRDTENGSVQATLAIESMTPSFVKKMSPKAPNQTVLSNVSISNHNIAPKPVQNKQQYYRTTPTISSVQNKQQNVLSNASLSNHNFAPKPVQNKQQNVLSNASLSNHNIAPKPVQNKQQYVQTTPTISQKPIFKQSPQNTPDAFQKPFPVNQTSPYYNNTINSAAVNSAKARHSSLKTPITVSKGEVSNVVLGTKSFTSSASYDITKESSQRTPNNFYCQQCEKTFTMFFALKKHHCVAKTPDDQSSFCSNCEEIKSNVEIDGNGRCDMCRGTLLLLLFILSCFNCAVALLICIFLSSGSW